MTACTDDERRRVAERLREKSRKYAREFSSSHTSINAYHEVREVLYGTDGAPKSLCEFFDRLADLIEPCDMSHGCRDTVACDPTGRGIDSIYDWCFERLEGADWAEDELYCSIMRAIEDYRHPELATARTVRPVDREALLELADEMGHPIKQAVWNQTAGVRREHIMAEYARRIREALGAAS